MTAAEPDEEPDDTLELDATEDTIVVARTPHGSAVGTDAEASDGGHRFDDTVIADRVGIVLDAADTAEDDDRTVVAARAPVASDDTVVAARARAEPPVPHEPDDTVVAPRTRRDLQRPPAPPVDEPEVQPADPSRIWRDLSRMHGVRSSADPSLIGPPDAPDAPQDAVIVAADRSGLPSVIRRSRRRGRWTLAAFAVVTAAAVAGIVAVVRALMG